ncbi:MAG TPA: glycosyl hydrolase family 28-related protein [Chryseolinea sp.]|nr:glycosyl hydrolase family 28-related protein [Chryseolinea sp.]
MSRLFSILFALAYVGVSIISYAQSVRGGGTNYNAVNNIFNVKDFGARGDGSNDDRAAIQAAIDAAIHAKGKLIIPTPANYYRINGTLFFQSKKGNQAFFDVEGQGHWEQQIVYQGPSGKPAVVIIGMKGGTFTRVMVKLGDGVSNSACFEIGTADDANSTAGFSFYDCTATLNEGANNQGWRLGEIEGGNADISQILFSNCKAEGWPGPNGVGSHWPGQVGFNITGRNTLALTWIGGSALFNETAVKLEQGGSLAFHSFQTSNNGLDFHLEWANVVSLYGGRFESGKQFLKVEQMSAHPTFAVYNAIIEDYKPTTHGMMFEFRAPGTLIIDGSVITRINNDYDARMFTLSTPTSNPFGTFLIRGGKINSSDPFVTAEGWKVAVENVVSVSPDDLQSSGYFTNTDTVVSPPTETRGTFTILGAAILVLIFLIVIYLLTRKQKSTRKQKRTA